MTSAYDYKGTAFEFLCKPDDQLTTIDIEIAKGMLSWQIPIHPDVYKRLKEVSKLLRVISQK